MPKVLTMQKGLPMGLPMEEDDEAYAHRIQTIRTKVKVLIAVEDFAKAHESLEQELCTSRRYDDCEAQADLMLILADVCLAEGRFQRGLKAVSQAEQLLSGMGTEELLRHSAACMKRAELHLSLGQVRAAEKAAEDARDLAGRLNEAPTMAMKDVRIAKGCFAEALKGLSRVHLASGQPDQALSFATRAVTTFREANDRSGMAGAWSDVASAYVELSDGAAEALKAANQSYSLFEALNVKEGMLTARKVMVRAYLQDEQEQHALDCQLQVMEQAQMLPGQKAWSEELDLLAQLDPSMALEAAEKELQRARRWKHVGKQEAALLGIAKSLFGMGRLDEAVRRATSGIALLKNTGSRRGQASLWCFLAEMHLASKRLDEGLEAAITAQSLFQEEQHANGAVEALQIQTSIHLEFEQNEEALRTSYAQIEVYKNAGLMDNAADAQLGLCDMLLGQNWPEEAIKSARTARDLFRDAEDVAGEVTALLKVSSIQVVSNFLDEAVGSAETALSMSVQTSDCSLQAFSLQTLATVYSALGRTADVERTLIEASELSKKAGDKRAQASSFESLVRMHLELVEEESQKEGEPRVAVDSRNVQEAVRFATLLLELQAQLTTEMDESARGVGHFLAAKAHQVAGSYERAKEAADEALSLYTKAGDEEALGTVKELLVHLSLCTVQAGDLVEICDDCEEMRSTCQACGCCWHPVMAQMAGQTLQVRKVPRHGVVELPAPDSSTRSLRFPVSAMRKAPYLLLEGRPEFVPGRRRKSTLAALRGDEELEFVAYEDSRVRVADPQSPIAALSECGDPSCGAHRLNKPEVRVGFRDWITNAFRDAIREGSTWWEDGLRYASLGSGQLLFDLELLERLRSLGVRIVQICLIDTLYATMEEDTQRALEAFADWHAAVAEMTHQPVPQIVVFRSADDFHEYASAGRLVPRCDLFVHCDASFDDSDTICDRLADASLAEGGLLVRLANLGSRETVPYEKLVKGPGVLRAHWQYLRDHADGPFASAAWVRTEHGLDAIDDPVLGEAPDVKIDRQLQIAQDLQEAQTAQAKRKEFEIWKVIHEPSVNLRAEPSTSARSTGSVPIDQELIVSHRRGDWVRLATHEELFDVRYSDSEELQNDWVLIDGTVLACGVGRLLEAVYMPPGRAPYQSAAERAANSVVLDGAAFSRARRGDCHGCFCSHTLGRRRYRVPGASRRDQHARVKFQKLYAELQELPEKEQKARLKELSRQEKVRFKQWWAKERGRWQAVAAELRQLPSMERQVAIANMPVEHQACLRAAIEEKRIRTEEEQRKPVVDFSFDKKKRSKSAPGRARNH